jgi:hypothetical protein
VRGEILFSLMMPPAFMSPVFNLEVVPQSLYQLYCKNIEASSTESLPHTSELYSNLELNFT